MNLIGYN